MKKLLSVLIACLLVISIIPLSASAETTSGTTGSCTWRLDGTVLTISGNGAMEDIYWNSSPPWGTDITQVIIEQGVTSIGSSAFSRCRNLTSITIPYGVTSIGNYAFEDCYSLTRISIPESVTYIGGGTFTDCTSLKSIVIPEGVKFIHSFAFADCSSLMEVTIPNSVEYIGNSSFENCTSLTSVSIPGNVTKIDYWAFNGCTKLAKITIPDSAINISHNVFEDTAYYNDKSNWENNALYIGKHLYKTIGISGNYEIKDGTLSVGGGTFNGCTKLTNITIPDSVTVIGDWTFSDCTKLTNITIPDSVTVIGQEAFKGCTEFTEITIPDSVTVIGQEAFKGCTKLAKITIPDRIITIGYFAFEDTAYYNDKSNWEDNVLYIGKHLCRAIGNISKDYEIKNGTLTIAQSAFFESDYRRITIPDSVIQISDWAFQECWGIIVMIPESVTSIGKEILFAETGKTDGIIECIGGSYAETYAKENDIPFVCIDRDNTNGDLDGDVEITDADATYLLMYTFFPEDYPLNGKKCDFNGDGAVTDTDAVYLLMYTFFPDDYPIH